MSAPTAPRKRAAKKTAAPRKPAIPTMAQGVRPPTVPVYTEDKITEAVAWKRTVGPGFVIEFPSGNFAKCQRTLNMPNLLANGKIPNPLGDLVREMLKSGETDLKIDKEDHLAMAQVAELVREQALTIFVEPAVEMMPESWDIEKQGVWTPSPGALDVNAIDFADLMYAFTWAQGAALSAAQFRERTEQSMAGLQHEQGVEQTSGGSSGDDE